jgi:hypothetical protein
MDQWKKGFNCTILHQGAEKLIVPESVTPLLYPAKHPPLYGLFHLQQLYIF